jgi:undecaprenyl-diphosphatase
MQTLRTSNAWAAELFRRMDARERPLCQRIQAASRARPMLWLFRLASRLGDGLIWYTLILMPPVVFGASGWRASLHLSLVGLVGLGLYSGLKRGLTRERPYVGTGLVSHLAPPLDRYSFPSGHTLHAVAFTMVAVEYLPLLGWVLVPFSVLVALSRVVLGLHYPSDVAAGAALGAAVAGASLSLVPV